MASSSSTSGGKGKDKVMDAFDEIAPSASTSASKLMKKPSYDIFINHRGPDVGSTLASTLYGILAGMALSVFLDAPELEYGDFLPRTIQATITSALLHIAIFSKRYAESPWCLAELSFMLKTGTRIIPVFYHVDPTDLRWIDQGKGLYVKAFDEHKQKGRYSPEKLREWKDALFNVSFYSGEIIRNYGDEVRLLKNIVSCVKEINNMLPSEVAKYPVGLKEIVQDFKAATLQSAYGNQDVQIVGIWGIGGSGKTTLAKQLYNEISSSMERSSFVFDVRDAASEGLLHKKQEKLLKDLGVEGSALDNIEKGKIVLSRGLRSVRVLIVLDDVDNVEQLDALLPSKDSIEKGSFIIVITRDLEVLKSWDISSIYKIKPLDPLHAKQLFCWHAFLKPYPSDGFEELVEKFLHACNQLPLSLKVFGAQLYGVSSKEYWEAQLHKIERILSGDIKKMLKVSYDILDDEEKVIFLDIAFCFIGKKSWFPIQMWNRMGLDGLRCWERLFDKCLVEVDNLNFIRMHDQLRDLGRDIAAQQSLSHWPIINVQNQLKRKNSTQGIIATSSQIGWNIYGEAEEPLPEKLVKDFPKSIGHLKHLKKIVLTGCSNVTSLPDEFCLPQLLQRWVLDECHMLSSVLNNFGNLSNLLLKHLAFTDIFLENITNLEHLNFSECMQLKELYRHITSLTFLNELYFSGTSLRELPDNIGQLSRLKKIWIKKMLFTSLPKSLGNLSSLISLSIENCPKREFLPDAIGDLSPLTPLSLQNCHKLEYFPSSLENLSLTDLSIQNCHNLEYFPSSLENLSSINLKIMSCPKLWPDFFEQLANLEKLNLSVGKMLSSLPAEFDNLATLQNIYLKSDTVLSTLPADIKQRLQVSYFALGDQEREMFLDAACFLIGEKKSRAIALWAGSGWSGLHGLQTLENKCLVELVDDPDYDGEKIIRMHDHIRDMGRLIANGQSPYRIWSTEQIINMKKLSMERKLIRGILAADAVVALKEYMHQSMGESSRGYQHFRFPTGLQILCVEGNEFTQELASLSEDLVWLRWEGFSQRNLPPWLPIRNLSVLEIYGANELEELWEDKEHAPLQLRELIITGTWSASFERFPSSISNLKHLIKIALLGDVGKEFGIKVLPEEFCDLQSLEYLELRHCTLLSSLPARFGHLGTLRHLDLCCCKELRILPNSFKQLRQLEYLDLSGCKKLALQIDILENITELKNVNLSGCHKLRQLPHQITDQVCLRKLRLEDTRLEDLPTNIGQLRKLELLTIGSPFLTNLPVSLGDFSSLKSLSIIDCIDLESLPENLGRLTLLEHLCIESSELRSLPEGFTELANLKTLKISGCPLSELDFGSTSSSALSNLRVIEIIETCVVRISITKDCCPSLETLHISRNDYLEEIEDCQRVNISFSI